MPPYQRLGAPEVAAFGDFIRGQWRKIEPMPHPNEEETREEFSDHLIERLGWQSLPQQEPGRGHKDIADALLFLDSEAKERARPLQSADRFRLGAIVVEHEARDTKLDRAGSNGEAPSSQLIRYLGRAEAQSGGACRWGLLTNGRFWRLYSAQARARAEGFVEFDLPAMVGDLPPSIPQGADPGHWLRVFLLLSRREGLVPDGIGGETFLDIALGEGWRYEQSVTESLSSIVFGEVFPGLVTALSQSVPNPRPKEAAWRAAVREAALIILYRLLFLFYAEDRDLLPVGKEAYGQYALRELRIEARDIIDSGRTVSDSRTVWWGRLRELFAAIAIGDRSMGLPPYNGGLFDDSRTPLLLDVALPDGTLAHLIDAMSREEISGARRWINYRDLSVQHLGGIYERLLEREVEADPDGNLSLRPTIFARKTSGSYYTPDELVRLIIRHAVGPLLEERRQAFRAKADSLRGERRSIADRLAELRSLDPATAFVSLRVCDPAMGSGHFLVSLVDYLADEVLTAIGEAPALVSWADLASYRSPLAARIEELRNHIRHAADENGWMVPDDQLDDRHLVRRIILKRVIYGVDLNPMAVELAKLSLWLHSFTVGAPLSFLDHHLRCGDSLFGEFVGPVERELRDRFGLAMNQAVVKARQSAAGMARIEELTDSDIGEVADSKRTFSGVEEATAGLRAFLDLVHADHWIRPENDEATLGREMLMGGNYGDPVGLASGEALAATKGEMTALRRRGAKIDAAKARTAATNFIRQARDLVSERRFLHWEAAFPGVWADWESIEPRGGFDAVIGNPPWDRMKLQEVE
ncbi:MAG: Eco57I restriction-modification methylase domain-containing protein [Stellaceae bacterium]